MKQTGVYFVAIRFLTNSKKIFNKGHLRKKWRPHTTVELLGDLYPTQQLADITLQDIFFFALPHAQWWDHFAVSSSESRHHRQLKPPAESQFTSADKQPLKCKWFGVLTSNGRLLQQQEHEPPTA